MDHHQYLPFATSLQFWKVTDQIMSVISLKLLATRLKRFTHFIHNDQTHDSLHWNVLFIIAGKKVNPDIFHNLAVYEMKLFIKRSIQKHRRNNSITIHLHHSCLIKLFFHYCNLYTTWWNTFLSGWLQRKKQR